MDSEQSVFIIIFLTSSVTRSTTPASPCGGNARPGDVPDETCRCLGSISASYPRDPSFPGRGERKKINTASVACFANVRDRSRDSSPCRGFDLAIDIRKHVSGFVDAREDETKRKLVDAGNACNSRIVRSSTSDAASRCESFKGDGIPKLHSQIIVFDRVARTVT